MTYGGVDPSARYPGPVAPYGATGWPTPESTRAPGPSADGYNGFLRAALIGTGAFTLGNLALAVMNIATWRDEVYSPEQAAVALFVLALFGGGVLAGYITLALWMTRTRSLLLSLGHDVPETWRNWASWLIPIYSWWGPYKTMEALTRRAGVGPAINVWWGLWCAKLLLGSLTWRVDLDPGALAVVAALDAPIFVGSWIALVVVMRRTTAAIRWEVLSRATPVAGLSTSTPPPPYTTPGAFPAQAYPAPQPYPGSQAYPPPPSDTPQEPPALPPRRF